MTSPIPGVVEVTEEVRERLIDLGRVISITVAADVALAMVVGAAAAYRKLSEGHQTANRSDKCLRTAVDRAALH